MRSHMGTQMPGEYHYPMHPVDPMMPPMGPHYPMPPMPPMGPHHMPPMGPDHHMYYGPMHYQPPHYPGSGRLVQSFGSHLIEHHAYGPEMRMEEHPSHDYGYDHYYYPAGDMHMPEYDDYYMNHDGYEHADYEHYPEETNYHGSYDGHYPDETNYLGSYDGHHPDETNYHGSYDGHHDSYGYEGE